MVGISDDLKTVIHTHTANPTPRPPSNTHSFTSHTYTFTNAQKCYYTNTQKKQRDKISFFNRRNMEKMMRLSCQLEQILY